jgi:hypothetical protein
MRPPAREKARGKLRSLSKWQAAHSARGSPQFQLGHSRSLRASSGPSEWPSGVGPVEGPLPAPGLPPAARPNFSGQRCWPSLPVAPFPGRPVTGKPAVQPVKGLAQVRLFSQPVNSHCLTPCMPRGAVPTSGAAASSRAIGLSPLAAPGQPFRPESSRPTGKVRCRPMVALTWH